MVSNSCGERILFEKYQKFETQSWNRFKILEFEIPVSDTINAFDIFMEIRHLPEFALQELKINLTIYMPSGEMRTADHLIEFTDQNGDRISQCLGDLCDLSVPLREDFIFPEPGTYRIAIENKYPKIELPGILEAGLAIKRPES